MPGNAEEYTPLDDLKEYSSFVADIDLTAATESKAARPARYLRVITAGSGALAIITATNDGVPTARVLTGLTAGEELPWTKICKILSSGTNVAKVRVGW